MLFAIITWARKKSKEQAIAQFESSFIANNEVNRPRLATHNIKIS